MTEKLTAFQQAALSGIREVIAKAGRVPEPEELSGNEETYLVVSFAGYRVLVYEDGAEILGNGLDRRLEKEDFHSLKALREQLLLELRQIA